MQASRGDRGDGGAKVFSYLFIIDGLQSSLKVGRGLRSQTALRLDSAILDALGNSDQDSAESSPRSNNNRGNCRVVRGFGHMQKCGNILFPKNSSGMKEWTFWVIVSRAATRRS